MVSGLTARPHTQEEFLLTSLTLPLVKIIDRNILCIARPYINSR